MKTFIFTISLSLLGFAINLGFFHIKTPSLYSLACMCFTLFYGWLLWFPPVGFLNFSCLDSGIVLLTIMVGLELFLSLHPQKLSLLGFCGVFEVVRFGILDTGLDFIFTNYSWVILCLFPLFVMAYAWVFLKVIKKTLLGLKTKGLIWKLFGFRVHKMLLLFKYF